MLSTEHNVYGGTGGRACFTSKSHASYRSLLDTYMNPVPVDS